MANGRHRRRRRARWGLTLAAVLLLLGATACEGSAVGQVTNRVYQESGTRYLLEIQQADGQRTRVRVTAAEWNRCWVGEMYPECKRPPRGPLRKV
jgi:hypothetical protein